jgi:hypothetical protein
MGPLGPGSIQYGSRYSMSRTCGPRDIISLVIPRIGDNKSLKIQSVGLQRESERLESKNKVLIKKVRKWYKRIQHVQLKN